jgi:hypothetical protein
MQPFISWVVCLTLASWPHVGRAWGDEGHRVVALIAEHFLNSHARTEVYRLLATDDSELVPDTSMASEALWADRFRDSDRDGTRVRYEGTRQWHYVDIELDSPSSRPACNSDPRLPAGTHAPGRLAPATLASRGPATACILDKIDQFEAELKDPGTSPGERRVALQFVLHLIGDLHQPLHAGDDHDEGGNAKHVEAAHWRAGSLHHYWDVEFVQALGRDPRTVARMLIGRIDARELRNWQSGSTADWARDSYSLARDVAYGMLPRVGGRYYLNQTYIGAAVDAVQLQLMRAGVRLAWILNRSLRQNAPS